MKFIDKKEVDKNALQKWDEDSIRLQRDLIEPYWNVKEFEGVISLCSISWFNRTILECKVTLFIAPELVIKI